MKNVIRLLIILAVALAVTGVLYVVSESEWATQQFASAPGAFPDGERGGEHPARGGQFEPSANISEAAATLGVSAEQLSQALGGMPPDYAQAAQALGLAEDEVRAAVEASLAASMGVRPGGDFAGGREGGEHGGGFNASALTAYPRMLLPIVLMIGAVALVRAAVERLKRRNAQPASNTA